MGSLNALFRQRRSGWSRLTGLHRLPFILGAFIVFALAFTRFDSAAAVPAQLKMATLTVGRTTVAVEVADDAAEQARGLSGRRSLQPGRGMVFLFNQPDRHGFWMNQMNFPIDIVWISGGQVAQISPNLPFPAPGEPPATVWPEQPVDMVLEVPAGYAQSRGWQPGLAVSLTL